MAWEKGHNTSPTWKRLRRRAERELDYRCVVCGAEDNLELDHILNTKRGGTDTLDNVQWMCAPHHRQKTQREATVGKNAWKRKPEVPPWETEGTKWTR